MKVVREQKIESERESFLTYKQLYPCVVNAHLVRDRAISARPHPGLDSGPCRLDNKYVCALTLCSDQVKYLRHNTPLTPKVISHIYISKIAFVRLDGYMMRAWNIAVPATMRYTLTDDGLIRPLASKSKQDTVTTQSTGDVPSIDLPQSPTTKDSLDADQISDLRQRSHVRENSKQPEIPQDLYYQEEYLTTEPDDMKPGHTHEPSTSTRHRASTTSRRRQSIGEFAKPVSFARYWKFMFPPANIETYLIFPGRFHTHLEVIVLLSHIVRVGGPFPRQWKFTTMSAMLSQCFGDLTPEAKFSLASWHRLIKMGNYVQSVMAWEDTAMDKIGKFISNRPELDHGHKVWNGKTVVEKLSETTPLSCRFTCLDFQRNRSHEADKERVDKAIEEFGKNPDTTAIEVPPLRYETYAGKTPWITRDIFCFMLMWRHFDDIAPGLPFGHYLAQITCKGSYIGQRQGGLFACWPTSTSLRSAVSEVEWTDVYDPTVCNSYTCSRSEKWLAGDEQLDLDPFVSSYDGVYHFMRCLLYDNKRRMRISSCKVRNDRPCELCAPSSLTRDLNGQPIYANASRGIPDHASDSVDGFPDKSNFVYAGFVNARRQAQSCCARTAMCLCSIRNAIAMCCCSTVE